MLPLGPRAPAPHRRLRFPWPSAPPSPRRKPPSTPRARSTAPTRAASRHGQGGRITTIDGVAREPGDRRLHLRQGAALRSARSTATIACTSPPCASAPRARARFARVSWNDALDLIAERLAAMRATRRRRVDPAALLRRFERPADPGRHRRDALPPPRRVAARAHGVRGADRRGQQRALRQDGRRSSTRTIPTRG